MKRITFLATILFAFGALVAQNPTDGNWKENAGTWEKDVTPAKYKFSQQTTEQVRANIFAVSGPANPQPAITATSGEDLTDGYIAVCGGQITGSAQNEDVRAGYEIVDGKLVFTDANSIGGWKNINFYVSNEINDSPHKLKITWPVNFSTEKKYYIYSEGGGNDPQVIIPVGEYTISYTQDAGNDPFRLKMETGGATTVSYSDPTFLLFTATEPDQVTVTETVSANGTVTATQTTQLHAGDVQEYTITADANCTIASVKYNEQDVTASLVDGKYTTPEITADATLEVVFDVNWCGNSLVTIGGASGTWYKASAESSHPAFQGAELGDFSTTITLGGELQVYPNSTDNALLGYAIDGVNGTEIALPKTADEGNNSKHYGSADIDIAGLAAGTHTIAVWFQAKEGSNKWDSNSSNNYVASFTKTPATGLSNNLSERFDISVNNGMISVKGCDSFDVYSIAGQKQNTRLPLASGAYIVKANNFVQKVLVK